MLDEEGSAPFEVLHAGRLSEASKSLGNGNFDVVLLSVSLPDSSGLGAVSKVHNAAPDVPLVVLCDPADEEFALDAVRNGAQEHLIRGQGDANLLKRSIRYAIERKQADRALQQFHVELQQTKRYMESLIESFADAIIAADCEGKVVRFNKGAEALAGYRRWEVIGRQGPVLYESEEDAKEVIRRMREGGGTVSAFETTFRAKEGARIPVLISVSILYDEEGREVGAVGFSKDLRERKRAQEQLIRSEKMASVDLLTAGVSHEI
ncbi:MAG: PAS domain S-box protein, partial [bacterium]|nr:PAS domain S-box protein [bacterium]